MAGAPCVCPVSRGTVCWRVRVDKKSASSLNGLQTARKTLQIGPFSHILDFALKGPDQGFGVREARDPPVLDSNQQPPHATRRSFAIKQLQSPRKLRCARHYQR